MKMNWLLERLREPSTWRGLVWLLTALGVTLRPEIWEQITTAGMALAGLLGMILTDAPKPSDGEIPPIELQARPESGLVGGDAAAVRAAAELRQPVPPPREPQSSDSRESSPDFSWNDR